MLIGRPEDGIDKAVPASPHQSETEEESSTKLLKNSPKRYPPSDKAQPSDTRASPAATDDPMEISDEDDLEVEDDHLFYFGDRIIWEIGRSFPTSTFIEQGITTWPEHHGANVSTVISQLIHRDIYHGCQKPTSAPLCADQDVLDHFAPPRTPHRVAFQVLHA